MDESKLQSIPLFVGLSKKELQAVGRLADEVDIESGRQLVREGDFSYEFFAIEEGTAEVKRSDQFLAELGPGDFFGEMGLVGDAPRNASVIAKTPMSLIVMTGSAFRQIDRDYPEVANTIRKAIEERCRQLEPIGQ
jgi:CRP/FNR family transcriptional regulator, cyclic AMP receptor protein